MKNKIITILSEILETKVNEQSNKDNAENWDSLNHIKIILELQSVFGIKIAKKDIDTLTSVALIDHFIQKKTAEKNK